MPPLFSFHDKHSSYWLGAYTKVAQGLSAAKDAVRMARIAKFYERLPKGPAAEIKSSGLLGRYQDKYFGKNPSAARQCF
jgi:Mitochondrial F1-F0 ATP synthase subunit F of fungi